METTIKLTDTDDPSNPVQITIDTTWDGEGEKPGSVIIAESFIALLDQLAQDHNA